jgi:predicted nucleotidyltransferase
VLKWPDARTVDEAVRGWAEAAARQDRNLRAVGYFGSYARGDWGVGSDVDLVVIVERSEEPFERRGLSWDTASLPVPADVLVYTEQEWERLIEREPFGWTLQRDTVWVFFPSPAHGRRPPKAPRIQPD